MLLLRLSELSGQYWQCTAVVMTRRRVCYCPVSYALGLSLSNIERARAIFWLLPWLSKEKIAIQIFLFNFRWILKRVFWIFFADEDIFKQPSWEWVPENGPRGFWQEVVSSPTQPAATHHTCHNGRQYEIWAGLVWLGWCGGWRPELGVRGKTDTDSKLTHKQKQIIKYKFLQKG